VVCRYVGLTIAAQQWNSSTTIDQCSPRWIVHQNQRRKGFAAKKPVTTTQQKCLGWCEVWTVCKAVDWGSKGCWAYKTDRYRDRQPRSGVTQFELIRGCETSGIVMSTGRYCPVKDC